MGNFGSIKNIVKIDNFLFNIQKHIRNYYIISSKLEFNVNYSIYK